jgi:hypothetical protein
MGRMSHRIAFLPLPILYVLNANGPAQQTLVALSLPWLAIKYTLRGAMYIVERSGRRKI